MILMLKSVLKQRVKIQFCNLNELVGNPEVIPRSCLGRASITAAK